MKRNLANLFFIFAVLLSLLAWTPAQPVRAASLVVNTLADENDSSCLDGDCSLRDAVQVAHDGDVITFSVTGTITLTLGQIIITNTGLTITGPGANQLSVGSDNAARVFYVSGITNTVTISGLTVENGYVLDGSGAGIYGENIQSLVLDHMVIKNSHADSGSGFPRGGGLAMSNGSLTITNSTISGNTSEWAGGGIGMMNNTALTMTNVIVDNNHAIIGWGSESRGGGVAFESAGNPSILTNVTISNNTAATYGGGLYVASSEVTLNESAVSGNTSTNHGGGAYIGTGTLHVTNTTFSTNQTGDDGGGLYVNNGAVDIERSVFNGNFTTGLSVSHGGAIYNQASSSDSEITIKNSTLSGNTANNGSGGGVYNIAYGGSISNSALVDIYNSTIVENTANASYTGGGLFASTGTGVESSSITLANSIVYGNQLTGLNTGENCNSANNATFTTDAFNFFENQATDCPAGTSDLTDTIALNAVVDTLTDNGGFTETRALTAGSPALNAGNNSTCQLVDQRGAVRPQGIACDIGAYEKLAGSFPTFADVPTSGFGWAQIESIYAAGITGGCSASPLNYCSNNVVTRAQMAVFLLRGIHGSSYTPPPATGTMFADVPGSLSTAAWIEQLANEGITAGCGGGNYCPNASVTRAQMAIFLLRAKYGSAYTPPAATGTVFNDVPLGPSAAWIEQLVNEGITAGCGGSNYCPGNPVTRAQMAIFLQRTFSLPLP